MVSSNTEKDKYHMISLIYGYKKMKQTYLQTINRLTDIENKLMVTKGARREGEREKLGVWD